MNSEPWCPAVHQRDLTLTVCGKPRHHTGPHALGDVEWWDDGRAVKRTVDGDVVGMGYRSPARVPRAPRTSAALIGGDLDAARADVGMHHPPESVKAAAKALRTSKSLRAEVLALVAARGTDGATSDEVERHTGRAHQSISATLYGLEQDALATRTGPVRRTQYANEARAYLVTEFGLSELRRLRVPRPTW